MTDVLDDLRMSMDHITLDMIRLLKERTDISVQIGNIKRERGLDVTSNSRETQLRNTVLQTASEIGLSSDTANRFLNYLFYDSIQKQSDDTPTHLSIFRRAKEMEMRGQKVIHMEVGEPDFGPPPMAGHWLKEGFEAGHTRYGLPAGMPQLRDALASHIGYGTGGNILVTPGARFGVFAAITSLLGPGDEIIIMEPAWPAYKEMARYCGAKPRIISTTLEGRWEPPMSDIEGAITAQTKMIVLCYPSNPTGTILPHNIMDDIMDIAMQNNIYVLSDEIYHQYHTTQSAPKSILEYQYERGIATQSFSKSHAMMGFRIGYAVSSPSVISRMSRASALCLTGVSGVVQYAALQSINHDTSSNTSTMLERLDIMSREAQKMGLQFVPPQGAMYLFVRYPGIIGMDLIERCLQKGLALAPGMGFGHYPEFVRLSAGTGQVTEGMHILRTTLHDMTWKR